MPEDVRAISDAMRALLPRLAFAALPLLLFLALFHPAILDIGNAGWLIRGTDNGENALGMHAWLLDGTGRALRTHLLNAPGGVAILFTDSNPLLGLLLKPFAAILLLANAQFVGLWLLLCLALHVFFSHALLRRFAPGPLALWCGVALLSALPTLFNRAVHAKFIRALADPVGAVPIPRSGSRGIEPRLGGADRANRADPQLPFGDGRRDLGFGNARTLLEGGRARTVDPRRECGPDPGDGGGDRAVSRRGRELRVRRQLWRVCDATRRAGQSGQFFLLALPAVGRATAGPGVRGISVSRARHLAIDGGRRGGGLAVSNGTGGALPHCTASRGWCRRWSC